MKIILVSFLFLFGINTYSQFDSTRFVIRSEGIFLSSTGVLNSLYSYSNKWGIFDQTKQDQLIFHLAGNIKVISQKSISCTVGFGGIANNHSNSSFLHEIFIKGKILLFDYSIGKEAYSPLAIDDTLTSGMFLNSANSAPYPRAILGVFNYRSLPFTNGWVEFKGGLGQSVLDDKRESFGKSYTLLHEKYLYLRLGNCRIQPYAGLMHSALFGGKDANGNKIPVDFVATFFSQGSAKIGGGEATNAAGAHMGFFDFGLQVQSNLANFQFYYQKPIRDGSSLFINKGQNRDHIIGLVAKINHYKLVKGVSFEFVKTTFQSGPGVADMSYPKGHPKEGQLIFASDIKDFDSFMLQEFGMVVHGWDSKDFTNYFQQTYNHGYEYGGRDNYMNNGYYFKGWSYRNQSMGSPLMHTAEQYQAYSGRNYTSNRGFFVNNRILAFHIGINGSILPKLSYLAKITASRNFGSYQEKYDGAMSWNETPDYYFAKAKMEQYSYLEFTYTGFCSRSIDLKGFLGYDWGELYHTFSGGISLVYTLSK